jgi:hypothetical protein
MIDEIKTLQLQSLNELSQEIGEWAIGHGFREDWELATWLDEYATNYEYDDTEYKKLTAAAEALRTNIIGTKLMLIVSEAAEAMETLRKVGATGMMNGEGNFSEEIADTHIRLFELSQMINPLKKLKTVGAETIDKIKINSKRPFKHGKKC